MRVCAVSFKECWKDASGVWYSSGGFPVQMSAIASLFDEMTLIVTERPSPGDGGIRLPEGARVVPLRKPAGSGFARKVFVMTHLPYYVYKILAHVRTADVVHVPLPGDIPFLGMIIALVLRKHLIARYCGSWIPVARTTAMNRLTKALMRLCAGGRNVMLATGAGSSPPARGIHWIWVTALSSSEIKAIVPRLDRGLSNPPKLIYAGRLSPEKGVDVLIKAVALLREQGFAPLPMVTIAGEGPMRCELVQMAQERGCSDLITFAGQLNREALSEAMGQHDICVQPSYTEGFAKVWLDALAYGLPVITTPVGSATEIVGACGERGWLVAPGSPEQLSEKLCYVLSAELDWPALRRRCREYAEAFTLEKWADEIARICAQQWKVRVGRKGR
jgi:glycosyltransferase involved in cell wall biosynthesis